MAVKEKEYIEFLRFRKQTEEAIAAALDYVREFEGYLIGRRKSLEAFSVSDVRDYVTRLIAEQQNTMERFLALARYVYTAGLNVVFIYFTSIIGGREVLPSISEKLAAVVGTEARDAIFDGLEMPPLGSPPDAYPKITNTLVRRLQDLGSETCRTVLTGNHHRVPRESFNRHKAWLDEAGSIEAFLRKVHQEAIAELERYMNEGRVWYEQEITPEVVEFVRGNQEVLSAVREGDYLYITKLPYSPKDWLKEADPVMKRYYGCHCPLARAAVIMGEPDIPIDWCYCSGGFEKLMFDVVFEEPTQVEVLESVLAGDPRCRFRVRIPDAILSR